MNLKYAYEFEKVFEIFSISATEKLRGNIVDQNFTGLNSCSSRIFYEKFNHIQEFRGFWSLWNCVLQQLNHLLRNYLLQMKVASFYETVCEKKIIKALKSTHEVGNNFFKRILLIKKI